MAKAIRVFTEDRVLGKVFFLALLLGAAGVSHGGEIATQATPKKTAAELLKAHQATWERIRTVEMVFDHHFLWIQKGVEHVNQRSSGNFWAKSGLRERLKKMQHDGEPGSLLFIDHYHDGQMQSHTSRYGEIDARNGAIKFLSSDHYRQAGPTTDPLCNVQLLRTVPILTRSKSAQLSLAEIFSTWKATVGETRIVDDDELWPVHAEYPSRDKSDRFTGCSMDLLINASRGYLIQRADFLCRHTGNFDKGREAAVGYTMEVTEFKTCRDGVFFPRSITCSLHGGPDIPFPKNADYQFTQGWTATQLNVNFTVSSDTFDFRFPEGAVVQERLADNKTGRVFIWGANNAAAKEFASWELYSKSQADWQDAALSRILRLLHPQAPASTKATRPTAN